MSLRMSPIRRNCVLFTPKGADAFCSGCQGMFSLPAERRDYVKVITAQLAAHLLFDHGKVASAIVVSQIRGVVVAG